jgi:hypothetical protein
MDVRFVDRSIWGDYGNIADVTEKIVKNTAIINQSTLQNG